MTGALLALFSLFLTLPTFLLDLCACAAIAGGAGALASAPQLLPGRLVGLAIFRVGLGLALVRGALVSSDGGLVSAVGGALPPIPGVAIVCLAAAALGLLLGRAAARAAEVSARFALDALPGAQAALEADGASLTDPLRAQEARAALLEDSRWRGAADGAAKLLAGDALLAPLLGAAAIVLPLLQGQPLVVSTGNGVALLLLAAALPPAAALSWGVIASTSPDPARAPLFGAVALTPLLLLPGAPYLVLLSVIAVCLLLYWLHPTTAQAPIFTASSPKALQGATRRWREAQEAIQQQYRISLPSLALRQDDTQSFSLWAHGQEVARADTPEEALRQALPQLFDLEEARAVVRRVSQLYPASASLFVLPLPALYIALRQALEDGLPLEDSALAQALVGLSERATAQEVSDALRVALRPYLLRDLGEAPLPVVRLAGLVEDELRAQRTLDPETTRELLQRRDALSVQAKRRVVLLCHKEARISAARLLKSPSWRFLAPEELPEELEIDFLGELGP